MKTTDTIELTLPYKADYVSVARLTVSGIANRLGFDIETIEDIKVAIAEVCNKLIKNSKSANISGFYKIIFEVSSDRLTMIFDCDEKSLRCIFSDNENELGLSIINALMDDVVLCTSDYIISISKSLEGNSRNE